MRVFLAFVLKEFMHILRDVRTMLLLLGMPVVQVLLFGFALNTEVRNLRVAVIDLSHDAFSDRLTVAVLQNPSFSPVRGAIDLADVDGLMRRGELELAVVVAPDFYRRMVSGEQGALQLIVDGSNPNVASIAAGYVQQILAGLLMEQSGGTAQPYAIDIQTRMLYNPALESTYNFVPGIIGLVLIIICSIMTSVSIVRERERGTLEVLLASPLKRGTMLLAKMLPYLALSFVILFLTLSLSYFALHVPIRGSIVPLLTLSTLYVTVALSVGLFVSTISPNQAAAILIAGVGMMMPTLLLSGMMFPIDSMPVFLQWLAQGVPGKWYVEGVRKVMIQGVSWRSVWLHHVVLAGRTLATLGGSMIKLKPRLGEGREGDDGSELFAGEGI